MKRMGLASFNFSTGTAFVALACALSFAAPNNSANAQAPNQQRFTKVETNWLAWARKNRVSQSQLALGYRGRIVYSRALNTEIEAPMTLASLSKAVTGACFLQLEKDEVLSRDTTLGEFRAEGILRDFSDSAADEVSLTQFLTHTSGLQPDITQGNVQNLFNKSENRLEEIALEAVDARNLRGTIGDYFYNNGNYAVIGAIIEAKTETTYEEACKEALEELDGMDGITPSPLLKSISAFGGWQASAQSFLTFANAAFGQNTDIQNNRFALPYAEIDNNLYYGPGVLFRKNRTLGTNVWHFGMLCFPDPEYDAGSYFAIIGGDWSVAVTHNKCLKNNAALELDQTLMQGIFSR
ncbi:serine hydrolase domain-containing protein [Pseudahrensia aquimaris]|uniref:Serine hydrolase domain-containing protein n=1 Tax=Pseudahrensia aquimaris TaxID=744461 RepID=A0ABW3FH79_9HYPH